MKIHEFHFYIPSLKEIVMRLQRLIVRELQDIVKEIVKKMVNFVEDFLRY